MEISMEKMMFFIGSDADLKELLLELAQGEYTSEQFIQDINDHWEANHG